MDLHRTIVLFLILLVARVDSYTTYELESTQGCLKDGSAVFQLEAGSSYSAAILKASGHLSYSLQMKCKIRLKAPPSYGVLVSIREVDFRTNLDGSCVDYIQIDKPICKRMVRYDEEMHYESSNNNNFLNVTYYTSPEGLDNKTMSGHAGFYLVFTAFQQVSEGRVNKSDVFVCSNDHVIWSGLLCDGHNNCGDMSDEDAKGNSNCNSGGGSTVLIILGVLIVFLMIVMCAATLLCTKSETVRRLSTRLRSRTISFVPQRQRRRTPPIPEVSTRMISHPAPS